MIAADRLEDGLRRHFGFTAFKPHQRAVIEAVLAGRPTLAVMPTGAGKSLCYQLPALLLRGVTLVVSPLIALMKDQVDALAARAVAATFINSTLGEREREERASAMARGEFRLVYLAPERFRSRRFLEALDRTPLALLAVDEAHCISQWGHDFRPDYARLGKVRERLGFPRTLALTATATAYVRADICRALRMRHPAVFTGTFDRPNVHLRVARVAGARKKAERAAAVAARLGSGILYAATRKSARRFAGELAARGVAAGCYHAGLSESERRQTQERFMAGKPAVVVATSAFGMGVDKPDIRFVIHLELPRSLEAYYQEIGRAGRDGAPALALLLFSAGDVFLQERIIRAAHPDEMLVRDVWERVRPDSYVQESAAALAAGLGVRAPAVHAALQILEQAGHLEWVPEELAAVALGDPARALPLLPRAPAERALLEALKAFGAAGRWRAVPVAKLAARASLPPAQVRAALRSLSRSGIIGLRLSPAQALRVSTPEVGADSLRVDWEKLRWRQQRELALLRRVNAFATARACRRRLVLRYFGEEAPPRCHACDVCCGSPAPSRREPAPARAPSETLDATWQCHARGESVPVIARRRGLPESQILGHLADLAEAGFPVRLEGAVESERADQIRKASGQCAPLLEAVRRALPPDFLPEEVRLVLAVARASAPAPRSNPQGHEDAGADEQRLERDERQGDGGEQHPVPEGRDAADGHGAQVELEQAEVADDQQGQAVEKALYHGSELAAEPAQELCARPDQEVGDR